MITDTSLVSKLTPAQLKDIQTKLKQLSYYNDSIDGLYGNNTKQAWKQFKQDRWLNEHDLISASSYKQLVADAAKNNINWNDFSTKISKYFTVGEVTLFDKARIPQSQSIKNNAVRLAKHLDELREEWGSAFIVASWYRPPAINAAVGGVSDSQHLNGSAADIKPARGDINEFQRWLDERWDMALGYGAKKGFVHLDLRNTPKRIRWNY